jgi:hypothetical protein
MWVWSGNRANHEPTVVCWGMRKGLNRQNCSLNHASTESRAASFFASIPDIRPAPPRWIRGSTSSSRTTARPPARASPSTSTASSVN